MKKKLLVGLVAGAAMVSFGVNVTAPLDPEMQMPLLRHIVAPREAIDLCGTWDFAHGLKTDTFQSPELTWEKITVPARVWFNIWDKPPKRSDALYRRTFTLTNEQAAKHAELFFELACFDTIVYVNGHEAFTSYDWATPFTVDVTPYVKEGENTLDVRCFVAPDHPDGKDAPAVPGWVWGSYTGISRPVHLELTDPVHIESARIETQVTPEKVLRVFVEVTNATEKAVSLKLDGRIADWDKRRATGEKEEALPQATFQLAPHEGKTVTLEKTWPEAHLWNPDDPFLYNLDLTLEGRDALRQRFGFREVKLVGNRVTLNGYPFVNRRDSVSLDTCPDGAVNVSDKRMRGMVSLYKSRGFVSARMSTPTLYRELDVCDETGFLVTAFTPTGAGYSRRDSYWTAVSNMVRRAATAFRNHPSIMNWALFNEFGAFYGVGAAQEQYPKMVAMGDYLKTFDPTTFWTSCGDGELGWPPHETGPAPVRSLHYPINTSWGGNDFPEIGWWYPEGRASWQGIPTKDKPVFISEDLYHGMNDTVPSMTRWGGDGIYEAEGYVKAWRDAVLMFADGYYYGGLGEWNPWFTCSGEKDNLLFADGELMPSYLVSLRHAFPNLASERAFEDDLYVHNQTFSSRKMRLEIDYKATGEKETREFELPPGGRYDGKLAFATPRVTGESPLKADVVATLYADGSNVFTRTFPFNVVPETKTLPEGVLLFAAGETPLKTFFDDKHVFTNATDALAAKPKLLIAAGTLSDDDGRTFDKWVQEGGKALLFASSAVGWSPVVVRDSMTHAYAWRRDGAFLADVPENVFSVWRPKATVGDLTLEKPSDTDVHVLLDNGDSGGIRTADAVRLYNGEGSWFVTTLPVEASFAEEPAARFLAVRFALDQLADAGLADVGYSFFGGKNPFAELFKRNGFLAPRPFGKAGVALAEASELATAEARAKLLAFAEKGGTAFVTGVGTNDSAFLVELGLGFTPLKTYDGPKNGPARNPPLTDNRRDWFTHTSTEGLLSGLSNTDFWFSQTELGYYYRWKTTGNNPVRTEIEPVSTGLFAERGLLHPNVLAEVAVGKGRVVVSSLNWATIMGAYPEKTLRIWRTLLNNCGVKTASVTERHTRVTCPFRGDAHLWAAPDLPTNIPAFFANGDDMRYFPVNLCGWSLEANNKCPVQPFPKEKLFFAGIPFKLTPPDLKVGAAAKLDSLLVSAPSKDGTRLDRVWILAALESDEGLQAGDPVVDMLIQNGTDKWNTSPEKGALARYGEDLGAYRHPIPLTKGKIGWEGHSEKTKHAALYVFSIENAFDKSIPVNHVLIRGIQPKGAPAHRLAILGVTWQVD